MIRLIVKSIIICLLAYAVVSAVFYSQTGRWLSPTFVLPSWPWWQAKPNMQTLGKPNQPTWRWQIDGRWHYGEQPPRGVQAQRIDQAAPTAKPRQEE